MDIRQEQPWHPRQFHSLAPSESRRRTEAEIRAIAKLSLLHQLTSDTFGGLAAQHNCRVDRAVVRNSIDDVFPVRPATAQSFPMKAVFSCQPEDLNNLWHLDALSNCAATLVKALIPILS
ncbi:hypothetical protein [Agrobacterium sp. SOY23]|uniref:hypothetical protein n=1 Tax=Agrobacterium sp. SOY23 TaxID=3014555 RepID=UPI003FA49795